MPYLKYQLQLICDVDIYMGKYFIHIDTKKMIFKIRGKAPKGTQLFCVVAHNFIDK